MNREPWHVQSLYLLGDIGEKYGTWFLQWAIVLLFPPLLVPVFLANFWAWRYQRRTYPFRCPTCGRRISVQGLCFTCRLRGRSQNAADAGEES